MTDEDVFSLLEKIHVEPGDILVLKTTEYITEAEQHKFSLKLVEFLKAHNITAPIVIMDDYELDAVNADKLIGQLKQISSGGGR
jgi:hypothetical protein